MGITKIALKIAIKAPKTESFENYLFIGPHPDDIEIGAGATVKKLVELGKKVTYLICLDGRFGDGASNGVKGDDLAVLRKKESLASAKLLGVDNVQFLDLRDGAGYSYDELMQKMAVKIGEIKPDIIFAPDSRSKSESHLDHINVGNAARYLACFAPYEGIMQANYGAKGAPVKAFAAYMTSRPNAFVKVSKEQFMAQLSSLDCHVSQYPEGSSDLASIKLYLKLRSKEYGLKHFCSHAEGFRLYTPTQMHCLPEAD